MATNETEEKDSFTEEQLLSLDYLMPGKYKLFGQKLVIASKVTKVEMPGFVKHLKSVPVKA